MQYSYFTVTSGFPHKTVQPFEIFSLFSHKVEIGKKTSGYTRPKLFVGWGEGLGLCEMDNVTEMQKCPKTFVHDCSYSRLAFSNLLWLFNNSTSSIFTSEWSKFSWKLERGHVWSNQYLGDLGWLQ